MGDHNRTADFFNLYSSDFNSIYGTDNSLKNRIINMLFRKSMRIRYEKTIMGCDPIVGKTVLDIGCGPGHHGIMLACKGARFVLGVDISEKMIDIAKKNAVRLSVSERCQFLCRDFMTYSQREPFDYSIVMGVLEYINKPEPFIDRVLSLTDKKAFFSFPADGGFLAWQRKLRYKSRCDLYMYTEERLRHLFQKVNAGQVEYERIGRDFFVTCVKKQMKSSKG